VKVSKNLLILLCVSIPSFMINLDGNIVAVSLTSIARSLHADFAAVEWVISAYTLTFAAMLMPAGTLADRFGRKRMLVIGLTLFTVASALCGAAQSDTMLNWARALQGVGAALQTSAALATLSHAFRGPARASAFSFWGSVIGVAIMLGPVAGGVITQYLGWRWAFYVNLPIGTAMIALTLFAVEDSKDPQAKRLDIAGVATFSGFLVLLNGMGHTPLVAGLLMLPMALPHLRSSECLCYLSARGLVAYAASKFDAFSGIRLPGAKKSRHSSTKLRARRGISRLCRYCKPSSASPWQSTDRGSTRCKRLEASSAATAHSGNTAMPAPASASSLATMALTE